MAHRRASHSGSSRHDEWDYRQSAWYFITICTDQRLPYFGEVRKGIMGLSRTGCVAAHYWRKIATLNDHAVLDAFVVMPNHVHGLLGLDSKQTDENSSGVGSLTSLHLGLPLGDHENEAAKRTEPECPKFPQRPAPYRR